VVPECSNHQKNALKFLGFFNLKEEGRIPKLALWARKS
jgi:hypothetical protein